MLPNSSKHPKALQMRASSCIRRTVGSCWVLKSWCFLNHLQSFFFFFLFFFFFSEEDKGCFIILESQTQTFLSFSLFILFSPKRFKTAIISSEFSELQNSNDTNECLGSFPAVWTWRVLRHSDFPL